MTFRHNFISKGVISKSLSVSGDDFNLADSHTLKELETLSPQLLQRIAGALHAQSAAASSNAPTDLLNCPGQTPSNSRVSDLSSVEAKYLAADLDPTALRREISHLLEFVDAAKTTAQSNWAEVLEEALNTIASHLQDIWSYLSSDSVCLRKGHECLLLLYDLLDVILTRKNGICICQFITLPVVIVFRDSSNTVLKQWDSLSPDVLDEVMFWLWRELFLHILLKNQDNGKEIIDEMITELEERYGGCHHIVLCGGDPKGFGIGNSYSKNIVQPFTDETDRFYPENWDEFDDIWNQLKGILLDKLQTYFQFHPTLHGYLTLCSYDRSRCNALHKMIDNAAPFSRAMALCALAVYQEEDSPRAVQTVLSKSYHLFESHDVQGLALASTFLLQVPSTRMFALGFLESHLINYVDMVNSAFLQTFNLDEVEQSRRSLVGIAKLPVKSAERKQKVRDWIRKLLQPQEFMDMLMSPFAMLGMDDEDEDEEEEEAKVTDFWNTDPTFQFHGIARANRVTQLVAPLNDRTTLDEIYIPKGLELWLSLFKTQLAHIPADLQKKSLLSFERAICASLPWMEYGDIVAALQTEYSRRRHSKHLKRLLKIIYPLIRDQKKARARSQKQPVPTS
ncbi:hypothetical protein FRC19_009114 [Serendipita sp. 401]|nr:hypothetical protein FRC19_009114 [Serendipita sp. 401]